MKEVPFAVLMIRFRVLTGPIIPGSMSFSKRRALTSMSLLLCQILIYNISRAPQYIDRARQSFPFIRGQFPFQYFPHASFAKHYRDGHA
jgi:hypothetical protein